MDNIELQSASHLQKAFTRKEPWAYAAICHELEAPRRDPELQIQSEEGRIGGKVAMSDQLNLSTKISNQGIYVYVFPAVWIIANSYLANSIF